MGYFHPDQLPKFEYFSADGKKIPPRRKLPPAGPHQKQPQDDYAGAGEDSTEPPEPADFGETAAVAPAADDPQTASHQEVAATSAHPAEGEIQQAESSSGAESEDSTETQRNREFREWLAGKIADRIAQNFKEQADAAEDADDDGEPIQQADSQPDKPPRKPYVRLTNELQREIAVHLSYGATLRQAAELAGCHYSTISKMLKRDEEFATTVRRLRQQPMIEAMHSLRVASRKQWRGRSAPAGVPGTPSGTDEYVTAGQGQTRKGRVVASAIGLAE